MKLCGFDAGPDQPFFLIAGPCVIESEALVLGVAGRIRELTHELGIPYIFKASFDKANRSSKASFRGPGIDEGLRTLAAVKRETGLALLTDVHDPSQPKIAGQVVDIIQVPAFLMRQTDLIAACAATGIAVNVKKGQFVAPHDMRHAIDKLKHYGFEDVLVTETSQTKTDPFQTIIGGGLGLLGAFL